jgi:hypothetical protein
MDSEQVVARFESERQALVRGRPEHGASRNPVSSDPAACGRSVRRDRLTMCADHDFDAAVALSSSTR